MRGRGVLLLVVINLQECFIQDMKIKKVGVSGKE